MKARWLLLALVCGCAAAPHASAPAPAPGEPPAALAQARAHADELGRAEASLAPRAAELPATPATPAATPIDCAGARDLVQRICELAAHICELGERPVSDEDKAEIARLCADGNARCARARTRTEERCASSSPVR